jgi:hypothetical protein
MQRQYILLLVVALLGLFATQAFSKRMDNSCTICEYVVSEIDSALANNKTDTVCDPAVFIYWPLFSWIIEGKR